MSLNNYITETIEFNNKEYPVRYWKDYKISVTSLAEELDKSKYKGEAGDIDDTIFYYVQEDQINLDETDLNKLLNNI